MTDRDMVEAFTRPPSGLQFVGCDFASGPDISAMALATRQGSRVVLITGENPTVDRDWINSLNASRKGDREALALALQMLASNRGAQVERKDGPRNVGYHGASIDMRFSLNGIGAMIDIDDIHGGAYATIHWHNSAPARARVFSGRFNTCVGDLGQYQPHHKATSCPRDWYSLAMFMDAGLLLAARGEAFAA